MKRVAKLVTVQLTTRVVVTEGESEYDIAQRAVPAFIDKLVNELNDNITEIIDDTEMPFDSSSER